jgi:DNA-binding NarL/FixJ family response regulator
MCRAVWVMIVGPTTDASKALRRAAGPDAQVVAMATSSDEAMSLLSSTPSDVIVVDGNLDGARELISSFREKAPTAAIVWVGDDPPEHAHASVPVPSDALEGAITRGLLAARAAKT